MTGELLTIDGVTRTIPEWARLYGLSRQLLRHRVRRGFSPADLFAKSKLCVKHSDAAVVELRRRVASGERLVDVAPVLGISETVARAIVRGHARKVAALERSEVSP
jgi:hypothetical protein